MLEFLEQLSRRPRSARQTGELALELNGLHAPNLPGRNWRVNRR
jgi:hypothetical protein